jgi:glycerol-3-phosphate acyltransferase PlsX
LIKKMIALDAMGGDYAPEQIVLGALSAAKKSVPVILVGQQEVVQTYLLKYDPNWENYPIKICNADSVIGMDDEPVAAVNKKRDSSIVKIIELVNTGQASVAISSGNSGAVMVAARFILGRVDQIDRPAIAGFLPTNGPERVLALDLGANTDCRPKHLLQFAYLGNEYMQKSLAVASPKIALLSNGQEDCKGSLVTKEAFVLLKNSELNFVGNIEPSDVFGHKADVVVCDGFAGNILLKTLESSFELLYELIRREIEHEYSGVCDRVGPIVERAFGPGGAVLLGVKGNVVICHGNSKAEIIEKVLLNYADCFSQKK